MSDLISRSALIEVLEEELSKCKEVGLMANWSRVMRIVEHQPTAYDVDKVVEQADEILYNRCYDTDYKLGTKEMEEVIRKGGKE